MNTFFIYLMAAADVFDGIVQWFYWANQNNNPIDLSYNNIFCNNPYTTVRMLARPIVFTHHSPCAAVQ